jgi:RNA polymerase sigma factor (sigma-70 family)
MVGAKSHRVSGQIQGLLDRGATSHLTDAQLLERFDRKLDAEAAFETLVLRHGPSVLSTCRQVLGDRGEADDAFQATFLVLARRAGSLHPPDSVGPWLQGVARRVSLKARTAAIRRRIHEQQSAVSVLFDPETRFDVSETLREEIARLPEQLRVPIMLCYFERMSYKSAAEELGVTDGTVRGRLAKGRDLLKVRLSNGLNRRSPILRRDSPSSRELKLPILLVDATTRAAVAFSLRLTFKRTIATSVLRLAQRAIKMEVVTRIIRIAAVILIGAAGTALIERQTRGARISVGTVSGDQRNPAASKTEPNRPAEIAQADPKRETPYEIVIQGEAIRTRPENDHVVVDGPGTMSLWVDRGFLTNAIDDSIKTPHNGPKLLKISWTEHMQLIGRTTDAQGQASGRAEFQGKVTAQVDDASIHCEQRMIVSTTGPVPLERIQVTLNGHGKEFLVREPRTKVAAIRAFHKVVAIGRMLDPDRNVFRHEQRFVANDALAYDSRSGAFHILGKGRVCFYANSPGAHLPAKVPAAGPSRTDICFSTGLRTRVGSRAGTNAVNREAEFSGGVTLQSIGVADPKTDVHQERLASDGPTMKSDKLIFVSVTEPRGAARANLYSAQLKASGHVIFTWGDTIAESEEAVFHMTR